MTNYSSFTDFYSLARTLSREFTRDKYKSFLIEHDFIGSEILEDPFGRFSKILVKEEFIRETLFYINDEDFPEFIDLLQDEGKLPKPDYDDEQAKTVENQKGNSKKEPTNKTPKIEKTVFISYRRKNLPWALLVYKDLSTNGFDVFFDYESIASGDFEKIIISNIKARAHFLVILTPSALDRCNQPGDWLRREIETAISEKRNIVPLFFEGFKYSDPSISRHLTGDLKMIKKYNGLDVPDGYFDEAMEKLRTKFLNIALDMILYPVSDDVQKVIGKHKIAANQAIAQIIAQGKDSYFNNEEFSRIDKSRFGRIAPKSPQSTKDMLVDLGNLKTKTPTCAYCHKPFSTPWQQRVTCDSCGAQYHMNCGYKLMNMQAVHICAKCRQPIDSKKFKTL
jgi:hypothetical protein